jgi:hypothetical protein
MDASTIPHQASARYAFVVRRYGAPALTRCRLVWIIDSTMKLMSRKIRAGWWRWHVDAPACAPAL